MNVVIIPSNTYRMLNGNKATPFVNIIATIPNVNIIKCKGLDLIDFKLNEGIVGNLNLLTISSETETVRTKINISLKFVEKILLWK